MAAPTDPPIVQPVAAAPTPNPVTATPSATSTPQPTRTFTPTAARMTPGCCTYVYLESGELVGYILENQAIDVFYNRTKGDMVYIETQPDHQGLWVKKADLQCPVPIKCPLPVPTRPTAAPPSGSITKVIPPDCVICAYNEKGDLTGGIFTPSRSLYFFPNQVKNGIVPIIGMNVWAKVADLDCNTEAVHAAATVAASGGRPCTTSTPTP
jgi:hypothetical protein